MPISKWFPCWLFIGCLLMFGLQATAPIIPTRWDKSPSWPTTCICSGINSISCVYHDAEGSHRHRPDQRRCAVAERRDQRKLTISRGMSSTAITITTTSPR